MAQGDRTAGSARTARPTSHHHRRRRPHVRHLARTLGLATATVGLAAGALVPVASAAPPDHANGHQDTLRRQAPRDLEIGSAVWGARDLVGHDKRHPTQHQRVLAREFGSLTPENDMKWAEVHPEPGVYDFTGADAVVDFARAH